MAMKFMTTVKELRNVTPTQLLAMNLCLDGMNGLVRWSRREKSRTRKLFVTLSVLQLVISVALLWLGRKK